MHDPEISSAEDPDAALLAQYAEGDPSAARLLTSRLAPAIYAQASRVLGDATEAEDVVQEAMVRLWRIAPDWRTGEAKVTTWLFRVVSNLCMDRLRKRPVEPLDDKFEPADPTPGADLKLQQKARQRALSNALGQLPDRQRVAVVLRHIEGFTNPEIAAILDVGVEAVESLTARGKRALTKLLAAQRSALGYEDDG